MRSPRRVAGAAGVLFAVLYEFGMISGEFPTEAKGPDVRNAGAPEIANYLSEQIPSISLGVAIYAIGFLFFLVFIVQLRRDMEAMGGTGSLLAPLTWAAAIVTVVLFLANAAIAAVVALKNLDDVSPSVLEAWWSARAVGESFAFMTTITRAALIGSVAIAVLIARKGSLLGWFSALVATLSLVGIFGYSETTAGGFLTGVWIAGVIAFPLWTIVVGLTLLITGRNLMQGGLAK